jgi:hypothetical protein
MLILSRIVVSGQLQDCQQSSILSLSGVRGEKMRQFGKTKAVMRNGKLSPLFETGFCDLRRLNVTHGACGILACAVLAKPDFVHSFERDFYDARRPKFTGVARCLKTYPL